MKRTSLTDIADKLGVSTTLVSMVLNGKGEEHRISDAMSEKVLQTAKELDYRPNQLARGLRTGRSKTLGLIVADIANPFFARLVRTIEDEAEKSGYHVIFGSSDEEKETAGSLLDVLKERQVDGFIIAPPIGSQDQIKVLQELRIPFVLIDRYFPEIETNYVITNNYEISFQLVSRLLEQGCRRIGTLFYNLEMIHMRQRLEGYKDAFREKGLNYEESWIREVGFDNLQENITREFQNLLSSDLNGDAFFFPTGELAVKAVKSSLDQERKPRNEIFIGCFDDPDAFYFSSFPTVSVMQPLDEMGAKAVELILNEINDEYGRNGELQGITLPSHFVRRGKQYRKLNEAL
jgi:LacI family transcriptional regulator